MKRRASRTLQLHKKTSWWKQNRANLVLVLIAILFALLVGEIIARIVAEPPMHPTRVWARVGNYTESHEVKDNPNVTRNVTVTYFHDGFKRWGNVSTNKTKVLILGDSFTEMVFVNNGEEWYSYLERAYPNIEFFVYGVGGYGTTQEYMALDEYADIIKPDVVIWQFYFNDFINNYYPADRTEYPLNNRGKRPYLEDGKIVYRIPSPLGSIRKYSVLIDDIMVIYDKHAYDAVQRQKDPFYDQIYGEKFWERPFEESKVWHGNFEGTRKATDDLLAMARARVPHAQFYLFSADDRMLQSELNVTRENNITYIASVPEIVDEHIAQGEVMYVVNDRHWNLRGNEIVGTFFVNYFRKNPLFAKSSLWMKNSTA